jgi:hypothetical protein
LTKKTYCGTIDDINLIKSGGGNGPMKPGSLLIFNKRFSRCQVLQLVQDEENETIIVVSFSSRERLLFFDIFIKQISLILRL